MHETIYHQSKQQFRPNWKEQAKYRLCSPGILGVFWFALVAYTGFRLITFDWQGLSLWLAFPLLTVLMFSYIVSVILFSGLYVSFCMSYGLKYDSLFSSKAQSARMLAYITSILIQLGCHSPNQCLNSALPEITKGLAEAVLKGDAILPSGFTINSLSLFPGNDAAIFAVVMRETLFEWLTYDASEGACLDEYDNEPAWDEVQLPLLTQDYIINHFPELIVTCPMRFSDNHMDLAKAGFSQVVAILKSVSPTNEEVRLRAKEWYESSVGADLVNNGGKLPAAVVWS